MSAIASQITRISIVCSTVYSGADQREHQSHASLAFVSGIHWWPVDSPHKRPVTQKMFPFDYVPVLYSSSSILVFPQWFHTMNTMANEKLVIKSHSNQIQEGQTLYIILYSLTTNRDSAKDVFWNIQKYKNPKILNAILLSHWFITAIYTAVSTHYFGYMFGSSVLLLGSWLQHVSPFVT